MTPTTPTSFVRLGDGGTSNPPELGKVEALRSPSCESVIDLVTEEKHCASRVYSGAVTTSEAHLSPLTSRPFCVVTGHEKAPFWIHETLLSSSSKYFATLLGGDWSESKEHTVILEDVESSLFDSYQQFLYYGTVTSAFKYPSKFKIRREFERLISCYVLGDRLDDGNFRDAVVDKIIENTSKNVSGAVYFPSTELTTLVYALTPPKSPLRRLVVDQHVFHGDSIWIEEAKCEVYDKDFLYDLAIALLEQRGAPPKKKAPDIASSLCHYHHHDGSRTCYKSK